MFNIHPLTPRNTQHTHTPHHTTLHTIHTHIIYIQTDMYIFLMFKEFECLYDVYLSRHCLKINSVFRECMLQAHFFCFLCQVV